jgi:hypothetical protein
MDSGAQPGMTHFACVYSPFSCLLNVLLVQWVLPERVGCHSGLSPGIHFRQDVTLQIRTTIAWMNKHYQGRERYPAPLTPGKSQKTQNQLDPHAKKRQIAKTNEY